MEIIAIVIAVVSLSIAMLTLGWTIYRDAIQKPRFRVSVAIKSIYQAGSEPDGPYVFVEALNLGPLPNRIGMVYARNSWWQRQIKRNKHYAFIYPDFAHIAASPADTRIEVGDKGTFVFPYDQESFLKMDFDRIGVADGYGHMHWSSRAQMQKLRKQYREDFSDRTDTE
jgi:hypothetical protein